MSEYPKYFQPEAKRSKGGSVEGIIEQTGKKKSCFKFEMVSPVQQVVEQAASKLQLKMDIRKQKRRPSSRIKSLKINYRNELTRARVLRLYRDNL